jgi:hypothetical protein
MSRIVDFYLGKSRHPEGYLIEDVWGWDYANLEFVHNYVQWLFPLVERSRAEPDSPILSSKDMVLFKQNEELRKRLLRSLSLLLGFYGFTFDHDTEGNNPSIKPSDRFEERAKRWLNANNHNYLRITRILRSLTLLGLPGEAMEFFAALQRVYVANEDKIGSYTYEYWKNAVGKAK